ncbi:MAG: hypothetical protein WBC44_17725 [Planctomycetaceae bacterium]
MTVAIRFALAGTVMLVAALAAWSIGGDPPDAAERRLKIAAMTETERSQLRRKLDDFQRLSEADREAMRKIHAAVELDPSLLRTLLDYEDFVSTLELFEQAELRQMETDERLKRVEHLAAERSQRNEPRHPSWLAGRIMPGSVYPPAELEQVMQFLADALQISVAEREQLQAMPPHERHLAIARRTAEKIRSSADNQSWPDSDTVQQLLKFFPDGWLKGRLERRDQSPEERRNDTIGLLMRSLYAEWQTQAVEIIPPSELRTALDSLPERQQAELQRRDPNELLRQVVQVIAEGKGGSRDFAKRYHEVTDLWREFDRFARGRRGSGPPGDRRDFGPGRRGDDSPSDERGSEE